MADPNADQQAQVDEPADQKVAANGNGVAGPEPDPFAVLEALKDENTSLKDRLLRTMADMENMRRRTDREVADAKIYGVSNFAREMLNVADNLRRTIANTPSDTTQMTDTVKHIVEGVDLTERDLLSRLARFGVKPLEPEGKRFDPNMHEALFEIPRRQGPRRHDQAGCRDRLFNRGPRAAAGQGRHLPAAGRSQLRIEGRGMDDEVVFTADQVAACTTALRTALALPPEHFPKHQFIGMISDEVEQLRAGGWSDAEIASLVAESTGSPVTAADVAGGYASPETRGRR